MRLQGFNALEDPLMLNYQYYLQDGDFEKYQPNCYLDKGSKDWLIAMRDSEAIWCRAIWIKNRLTNYYGPEWHELNTKLLFSFDMINRYQNMIDNYDDIRREQPEERTKSYEKGWKKGPKTNEIRQVVN